VGRAVKRWHRWSACLAGHKESLRDHRNLDGRRCDAAKALLTNTHATISHFIDHALILENMLGASQLPLTLLVDRDGRVLQRIYGARQWDSEESLRLIDESFTKPSR